ncbi:MAG: creatininase family protein [Chloroflexi bacterium]|nr:creatininase family protein [Chloroflexota bacterium]
MKAEVIVYEELTFPEVEALPRDILLLIPLGDTRDYNWSKIADRVLARTRSVSVPDRVCVFPAIPYGFRGSSREVDPAVFKRVIQSLIATLHADGFTNVFVINGYGPQGFATISVARKGERESRPVSGSSNQVALIPTGHTEQHAFHLPLSTDTLIIDAIARGVEAKLPDTILRLPTWPYGVSMHRRQYPGTLTIDPRAWEDFFVAVVGQLRERGLKMAYLINGHGGNHSFLVNITKFCGDRWPDVFVATSFLHTTNDQLNAIRTSAIGGMGHAGELETSYILHLRPDLVNMARAVDEVEFTATPNYYMDWIEGGALIANPPWTDDTLSGAYGAATQGTAEKGRLWLDAAIEEKVGHVHEIIEQQRRREERRGEGWVTGSWRKRLDQL